MISYSTLTKAVVDEEWVNINQNAYSSENVKANINEILSDGKGFVSNYAKNNEFEDKAEVYAYLITTETMISSPPAGVKEMSVVASKASITLLARSSAAAGPLPSGV